MFTPRPMFLIMTMPPGAGGRRRRPHAAGGDTLPLPAPSPEPQRTSIDTSSNPKSYNPDPYALGVAPPPSPVYSGLSSAPPRRRGQRAPAIITAFVLLLALGGAVYALSHQVNPGGVMVVSPTVVASAPPTHIATTAPLPATQIPATPVPATAAPTTAVPDTATATIAPATTQPTVPAVALTPYTAPNGMWSIGVPAGATSMAGTLSVQGLQIDQTTFDLGQMAAVTVSTLPVAVTDAQAQLIFAALVAAGGVTNVAVVQQPTGINVGDQEWQQAIISGTVNGQSIETAVYYTPHGNGSEAISTLAPADDYTADDQSEFTPMVASFRFLA